MFGRIRGDHVAVELAVPARLRRLAESLPRPRSARAARLLKVAAWVGAIVLVVAVLDLLGVPVSDWIRDLFKKLGAVPPGAIVGGAALETLQTGFAALAWLTILRAAFPQTAIPFRVVLACYSVSVALNDFLPGNIGTLVMLMMFIAVIEAATFASILSGFVVQKIPFTILSAAVYVYLFLSVGASLSLEGHFIEDNPAGVIILGLVVLLLLALLARIFWRRARKLREELKSGGAVVTQPRRFLLGVAFPEVASFAARLGIIAVFLAAYSIPVTFHTVVSVAGANSVSKSVSPTPGGAGVMQVLNVAALQDVTSKSTATAYSVAQQLIISTWDVLFALALVVWVFGWTGGKELVQRSKTAAEEKRRELQEKRHGARAH